MNNKTKIEPVFLLGAGRSGTKFLRDILGVSSDVKVIPYDVGYVWRYGNESFPHDEFIPEMLTNSIKNYVISTLPELTKDDPSKTKAHIFIEKSVPNTLRPAFLHSIYPDAKFIHLIRDGRAVTESAMRLWKASPEKGYLLKKLRYFPWKNYRYAVWYVVNMIKGKLGSGRGQQTWGPRYKGIDEDTDNLPLEVVCARQWKKCIETSLSQLSAIESKNILEVRYEELMASTNTLEQVCDFLAISDKQSVVEHYSNTVICSNTDKWKSLLSDVQLSQINNEIENLNSQLGYV